MRNDTVKGKKVKGVYEGLIALTESSFPKKCEYCEKVFANLEEFLLQTEAVQRANGFQESILDNERVLYLFRNCSCGSTLMDSFQDRRDYSANGRLLRRTFIRLYDSLVESGLEKEVALQEVKEIFRGVKTNILKNYDTDIE